MTSAERIVPIIPRAPEKLRLSGRQANHESNLKFFRMPGRLVAWTWILVSVCLCAMAGAQSSSHEWVATWQGSPTPGGTFYSPGCPSDVGLNNQTAPQFWWGS